MVFQGHYSEPSMKVVVPYELLLEHRNVLVSMLFNPILKKWEICMAFNGVTKEPIAPLEFKQKATI